MRVAAAESMPLLLECARVRGPEYLTQMWHFMCDALIKAIGTEPDSDVLSEIMHSFAKVTRFTITERADSFIILCSVSYYQPDSVLTCALFMNRLSQCIELMGDGCLNNEHFEELGGILKAKLEEHFKNQELRQGESCLYYVPLKE